MARALQVKEAGGVVAGLEHERGGEVNRHGACARGRVGGRASVQRQGVKTGVGIAGHGVVSSTSMRIRVIKVGGDDRKSSQGLAPGPDPIRVHGSTRQIGTAGASIVGYIWTGFPADDWRKKISMTEESAM